MEHGQKFAADFFGHPVHITEYNQMRCSSIEVTVHQPDRPNRSCVLTFAILNTFVDRCLGQVLSDSRK